MFLVLILVHVYFFSYRYRLKPENFYYRQKEKHVSGFLLVLDKKTATFALTVFHYWSLTKIYHPIITLSYLLLFPEIDSFYHNHTLYDTFYQGLHLCHVHTNFTLTLSFNLIITKHTLQRYNPWNVTSIQSGPNCLHIWVINALFLTKFLALPLIICCVAIQHIPIQVLVHTNKLTTVSLLT